MMIGSMPTYRCFLLDKDGKLSDVSFSDHETDDDAVSWAERRLRTYSDCSHAELWVDDRIVRMISR